MFWLRNYRLLAAVLGVLATVPAVLWFMSWLAEQGESEVAIAARRTIGVTELSIDSAARTLAGLAGHGLASCGAEQVDLLRRAVVSAAAVKQIAVISPDGQTLCTDAGALSGTRPVVIATGPTTNPEIMLDVVRVGDGEERALRVRRRAGADEPELAALLAVPLLLPQVDANGRPFSGIARMTLADGTLIGATGAAAPGAASEAVTARAQSQRYGPVVAVAQPSSGMLASHDDLRRIVMMVAGLIAVVILAAAFIIPWRQRRNPAAEIERGLAAGEFVPYYQPIVDIKSGRLLGAEVLARWRKPDGTIITPGHFIPLVESIDLVIDLTRAMMRQVREEAGATLGKRPDMYVAFNIAPLHFADGVILDDVSMIFEGAPIRLSQVVLEVTERHEIENLNATRRVIAGLQALGCRIAIDDVGTGHNGLSSILKLGVDIIKIDKLFVDAIGVERHSQAIVETLVDLARNLRMQIVAEGVETFEQVIYLREHGISAAQGHVFAPALPGSAFLKLVEAIDPDTARAGTAGGLTQGLRALGRTAA